MLTNVSSAILSALLLLHGCSAEEKPIDLKYKAAGEAPESLAVYEGWFGSPHHISVGYSTQDPANVKAQIRKAKSMGISGFVVDWYGDRDPFIDRSYAVMQETAAKNGFKVAMMYDEADQAEGATDVVIADFTVFHDTYLTSDAKGRKAYLTYQGRPVIFIFPHGTHTNWDQVRRVVNQWQPAPLLIQENQPAEYASAFDGFYPWIHPGPKGWSPDGSSWGGEYLTDFYKTMASKYTDKIIVGGIWPGFDDSKASWGLNRHIATRCGQTYRDTSAFWRSYFPAGQVIPFQLIATWNDYEEGSAIEPGLPTCDTTAPATPAKAEDARPSPADAKP